MGGFDGGFFDDGPSIKPVEPGESIYDDTDKILQYQPVDDKPWHKTWQI